MSIKHGYSKHPLYNVYIGMHSRCYNKKAKDYQDYGGRGIKVCKEWRRNYYDLDDFQGLYNFIKWVENLPIKERWEKGLQLDRKNNDKNYSPKNCRFVTCLINCNNKNNNIIINNGKYKNLSFKDFYKQSKTSISYTTALSRYCIYGYSLEDSVKEEIFEQKGIPKLSNRGSTNGSAKLNEKDVKNIKKLLAKGFFQREIAEKYNVTQTTISAISLGRVWQWLK